MAVCEQPGLHAVDDDYSDRAAFAEQRYAESASPAAREGDIGPILRVRENIRDLNNRSVQDRPTRHLASARGHGIEPPNHLVVDGDTVVLSDQMKELTVEAKEVADSCTGEAYSTLDNRIEHRLDVGRRRADDAKNLARRGLLLQCFGHLRVSLCERLILLLQFA